MNCMVKCSQCEKEVEGVNRAGFCQSCEDGLRAEREASEARYVEQC